MASLGRGSRAVGSPLAQVFGREHAPGPAQDGVLGSVIGVLLGRDLQDGGNGALVGIKCVPHHLCDVLVDEYDANVVPVQKLPVGRDEKGVQGSTLVGWATEGHGLTQTAEDKGKGCYSALHSLQNQRHSEAKGPGGQESTSPAWKAPQGTGNED